MTSTATAAKQPPGAARVAQVEGILLADDTMKTQVGPKDAPVLRRDGTATLHFHRLSVAVAERMMAENKEPMQTPKPEVLNIARLVLDEQAEAVAMAAEAPAAPAAPTPAPAAAPSAPAAAVPAKTAAISEAAPAAAKAKRAPVKKAAAPVAAGALATPAKTAAISEEAPGAVATEPDARKVDVHLSIYSLIVSAIEISERDTRPGASERRAALVAAGKGYYAHLGA